MPTNHACGCVRTCLRCVVTDGRNGLTENASLTASLFRFVTRTRAYDDFD